MAKNDKSLYFSAYNFYLFSLEKPSHNKRHHLIKEEPTGLHSWRPDWPCCWSLPATQSLVTPARCFQTGTVWWEGSWSRVPAPEAAPGPWNNARLEQDREFGFCWFHCNTFLLHSVEKTGTGQGKLSKKGPGHLRDSQGEAQLIGVATQHSNPLTPRTATL